MQTKEDLIELINKKYNNVEAILRSVPAGCEDSLRPILEACVKLFWLIKYEKEFVWINSKGQEEFNLNEAIKSEKFSSFFSPLMISDMHTIRLLGNKSVHADSRPLTVLELNELFDRLRKIVREMERILGISIIPIINKDAKKGTSIVVEEKPIEKPKATSLLDDVLLDKIVKHWVYGKGKVIKVEKNKIVVQFGNTRKEYSENDFKNGFIKLVDEKLSQKSVQEISAPRTYTTVYENKTVCVGSIVLIRDLEKEKNMRVKIVECGRGIREEASINSPLGRGLLGAIVGDCVTIHTEDPYIVKVLEINNSCAQVGGFSQTVGFSKNENSKSSSTISVITSIEKPETSPKFTKQPILQKTKNVVLGFMRKNPNCSITSIGLTQSEIFHCCGFSWGYQESSTESNQQYWIVACLKELEFEGLVQQDIATKFWRLTEKGTSIVINITEFAGLKIRQAGEEIRKQSKMLVLDYMKSNEDCAYYGKGLRQAQLFRLCGFDWGEYEKAESSRQQYWIVGLLRTLEKEGLVQRDGVSKKWRLV